MICPATGGSIHAATPHSHSPLLHPAPHSPCSSPLLPLPPLPRGCFGSRGSCCQAPRPALAQPGALPDACRRARRGARRARRRAELPSGRGRRRHALSIRRGHCVCKAEAFVACQQLFPRWLSGDACHLPRAYNALPGHGPLPLRLPQSWPRATLTAAAERAAGDNSGRCGAREAGRFRVGAVETRHGPWQSPRRRPP